MMQNDADLPLVSIIVTTFNSMPFIAETLSCIYAQDYKSLEVLIVDDFSSDATYSYIEKNKHANTTLVRNDIKGRGFALNKALSLAKGKWISIWDADDLAHSQKILLQIQYLTYHPEITVLGTEWTTDQEICLNQIYTKIVPNAKELKAKQFIKKNMLCHSSVLINKLAIDEVQGYRQNRKQLFDFDLWFQLAANQKKFAVLVYPLTFKRLHKNQSFERKKRLKYLWETFKIKIKFAQLTQASIFDYFFAFATFFYGLLPIFIRQKAMRYRLKMETN